MPAPLLENVPNLLPFKGEAYYLPGFFSEKESDGYLELLQNEISWKQEPIRLFGKEVMQPRLTAWLGNKEYGYSGIVMRPLPFTPPVLAIKHKVEGLAGVEFNSVLLNLYRSGADSMGWHRDNEKGLGPLPVIASVSFGASRTFQFRDYETKKRIITLEPQHGSLLLMGGQTQTYWQHRVAKTAQPKAARINLTFRSIV